MARQLTILSIDFTYFQKINENLINQYPEGKNISSDMSEMIWSSYYTKSNLNIADVTINTEELNRIKEIINKCNKTIPVEISINHKPIYTFISNMMHDKNAIKLHLIHIDMYHDMFNNDYEIDNNNWLKFITEDFDTSTDWITNPVSKNLYGLNAPIFEKIKTSIPTDNELIIPERINGIYINKNVALLPPHIDTEFTTFTNEITNQFKNTTIYGHADKIRNIDELVKQKQKLIEQQNASNQK